MTKLSLPTVTLVCIDCVNYGEAITAIKKSMHQVDFAKVLFFTDIKAYNPKFGFEIVKIDKLNSKEDYSRFMIKELGKYIETDYVLVIQHDGFVLNANVWEDQFLEYDYIGAPWLETDGYNVGNGGFSVRSNKLQKALLEDDMIKPLHPEDSAICRVYRPYLEDKYSIKFAPPEMADKFSFELREPSQPTFGFHGKFHEPFKPTVVIKRSGAIGDCVALEPVLRHYHEAGYQVAIDIPLHIAMIYAQHHYPIKHITQLDGRINYTTIDLDGSYESNPKHLHLSSYYDSAGVLNGELRNPQLNFKINDHNRLFKKYIVLHIDKRDQASRNIYGIIWEEVVAYLNGKGYTIIQVGLTDHEEVKGAIHMQTCTTNLLLYLIAGADYMIGIDSGPSNIAVACNIPSVIFFGSVDPALIYPDLSNIVAINRHDELVCTKPYCWANTPGSVTGTPCYINDSMPPCTQYDHEKIMTAITEFI